MTRALRNSSSVISPAMLLCGLAGCFQGRSVCLEALEFTLSGIAVTVRQQRGYEKGEGTLCQLFKPAMLALLALCVSGARLTCKVAQVYRIRCKGWY